MAVETALISFGAIKEKSFTYRLPTKEVDCEFGDIHTEEYGYVGHHGRDVIIYQTWDEEKNGSFERAKANDNNEVQVTQFTISPREDVLLTAQDYQALSRLFEDPEVLFLTIYTTEIEGLPFNDEGVDCKSRAELVSVAEDYQGTPGRFAITYKASAWQRLSRVVAIVL
jgi:hypothetical protein